ncbi:hypothetical protein L7F22_047062 [Adiantum nelumboides]|nr:hypothetical protein [Adiantum nelumboides]
MCGASKCGSLVKEDCIVERSMDNEDYIPEHFLEQIFEPFGWTEILATLDVCVNELIPTKFCDEKGYDLVSCFMLKLMKKANEICEHEIRGTNSYVMEDATKIQTQRAIQPCQEIIIGILKESTIIAPDRHTKKDATMSSSIPIDVQPSKDQKKNKEEIKDQSLPTLIKFGLCGRTKLKVACSPIIDPYATNNLMSNGTWIMMESILAK